MGLVCQFEQEDPLFDVPLVRSLVPFDLTQAFGLLGAPAGGQPIEVIGSDPPVQAIDVGRIDAALEPDVLGLQPRQSLVVEPTFVDMALAQRSPDLLKHPGSEGEIAQHIPEARLEELFTDIPAWAAQQMAGAPVVDVAALLALRTEEMAAVAARDQALEGPCVLARLCASWPASRKHVLHTAPQFPADQRLVRAPIALAPPVELAHVDRVLQQVVHHAARDHAATLAVPEPRVTRQAHQAGHRDVAGGVPAKQLRDDRARFRVWVDRSLAVGPQDVAVTDRCGARPDALPSLLEHALARLLGEVVDVLLGHQDLDPVHELLRGLRLARDDRALFDQVQLEALDLVECDPVLGVPVEPVRLFDQNRPAARRALEECDHTAEGGPAGLLGRLDVDEGLKDREALCGRIALQEPELGRDAEALLFLLLRADPGVDDHLTRCGRLRWRETALPALRHAVASCVSTRPGR